MAQDPLGPFGQYITQPLNPTPEAQPTGYEGAGGALAHIATNFLNGMKQARAQKFALQAMQEQKEENAYNTALQHVEASGLPQADKEMWKAKLAQPLLQRIAADKEVTSESTGHPATDFFKNLAVNLTGGQLPKKKGPLDLSVPLDAIAYASAPENSAQYKAQQLDQQAAGVVTRLEQKAKAENRVLTENDLLGDPEYAGIASQYPKYAGPSAVPGAFKPILAVKQRQGAVVNTGEKVDQAVDAYMKANNLTDKSQIPPDAMRQILQANRVIVAAPVSKGIVANRTAVALAERFPYETDLLGQPKKPGELYSLATLDGKEGIVPVDRNMFQWERVMGPNGPTIVSRNRLNNQTTSVPEYSPILQNSTTTLSGVDANGVNKTQVTRGYSTPHGFIPGATATPPASINTAPLNNTATPVNPSTTVAPTKSSASGKPKAPTPDSPDFWKPKTDTTQPTQQVQATPAGGIYPKPALLPPASQKIVESVDSSMHLVSQLKNFLMQKDPATGRPFYEDNSAANLTSQKYQNLIYKIGFSPDQWNSTVQPLTSLLDVQAASPFMSGGSQSMRMLGEVQQHIPRPTDTFKNMWDKIKVIESNLPFIKNEMIKYGTTKYTPTIVNTNQLPTTPPVTAQPPARVYVAPKL